MKKRNILFLVLLICTVIIFQFQIYGASGLEMEFKNLDLFLIAPKTQLEIDILQKFRSSKSEGLIFLNGIGELGGKSYSFILGSTSAIKKCRDFLVNQATQKTPVDSKLWPSVGKITISPPSTEQLQSNTPQQLNPRPPPPKLASNIQTPKIPTTGPHVPPQPQKITPKTFAPIRKIPRTNLFSSLLYKTSMKRFPTAWVTYTTQSSTNQEGNYLQVDQKPLLSTHYWGFGTSEEEGFYILRNKQEIPAMVATIMEKPNPSPSVILIRKPDLISQLTSPIGVQRPSALWKLQSSSSLDTNNSYSLINAQYPQGIMTWNDDPKKSKNDSHLLEISLKKDDIKKYEHEWKTETIFRFDLPEIQYEGVLNYFEFDSDLLLSLMNNMTFRKRSLPYNFFTLDTPIPSTVSETIMWNDTLHLTFDQDLSLFSKVKLKFSFPTLASFPIIGDFDLDLRNLDTRNYTVHHQQLFKTENEIQPLGKGDKELYIYFDKLENIEIPFKGLLVVRASSDRMLGDYSGYGKGPVPLEVAHDPLTKAGFKVNERKGVLDDIPEYPEYLKVTGTLKGSFVIDVGFTNEHKLNVIDLIDSRLNFKKV